MIVKVPPYPDRSITSPVSALIYIVTNAGRSHDAQPFTYTPEPGMSSAGSGTEGGREGTSGEGGIWDWLLLGVATWCSDQLNVKIFRTLCWQWCRHVNGGTGVSYNFKVIF